MRLSKAVYEQGPVVCGLCHLPFVMSDKDRDAIEGVRGRWSSLDGYVVSGLDEDSTAGDAARARRGVRRFVKL